MTLSTAQAYDDFFAKQAKPVFAEFEDYFLSSHNASKNQQAIGVFDSGMGGLSVLQHLVDFLPNERFIYLADTKHVPYGERSAEEIEALTASAVAWLYNQGCKLVVVACNSASTHSLPNLRSFYGDTLPIVGLVPALKPAVAQTQTKTVAVLATKATNNGYLLNQVIEEFATPSKVKVLKYFEPSLVPWVETGMSSKNKAYTKLANILTDLKKQQADYLVLGCTHYPFFKHHIHKLSPTLNTTDSGIAIAKRVVSLLERHDLFTPMTEVNQMVTKASNSLYLDTNGKFNLTKCIFYSTSGYSLYQNKIKTLLNSMILSQ